MRITRILPLLLLPLAALAGCDSPSDDGRVDEDDLVFIRAAADAPPFEATVVSFWAKRGEDVERRIDYENGEECLRIRIRDDALLRYPDGRRFQEGDSVFITIRVVNEQYFNFEFSPAGLEFDPDEPAELRVSYQFADPDLNQDGEVDGEDEDFEFGFFRQELPGQDWQRIGSARLHDLEEVRADLEGFSRYALAGG